MATVAMETKQEKGGKIENAPNLLKTDSKVVWQVKNEIQCQNFQNGCRFYAYGKKEGKFKVLRIE